MRVKFIHDRPIAGWYGLDFVPGDVVDIPEHLAWCVKRNPGLFGPVGSEEPIPPRRGRPRKAI